MSGYLVVERNLNLYMSEIKKVGRIQEVDMAKGLLILLMVAFHLGLFNKNILMRVK